jgi:serine/threonine protein kinase
MVAVVGRLGVKVYYGDASRTDLLHAAGCERAKLFVVAVDEKEEATKIAENVRHHYPHLKVLARARDRQHYWELRKLGCIGVFRETFGSAYEAGVASLIQLGYRKYTANRLARKWREHEERTRILDFGVSKMKSNAARRSEPSLTAFDATLGSFAYMGPEQVRGSARVDERADLYALGAVAFRALTGRLPFEGSNALTLIALKLDRDPPSLAQTTGDTWPTSFSPSDAAATSAPYWVVSSSFDM